MWVAWCAFVLGFGRYYVVVRCGSPCRRGPGRRILVPRGWLEVFCVCVVVFLRCFDLCCSRVALFRESGAVVLGGVEGCLWLLPGGVWVFLWRCCVLR